LNVIAKLLHYGYRVLQTLTAHLNHVIFKLNLES